MVTLVYVVRDIVFKVAAMDLIRNAQVRTLQNTNVFKRLFKIKTNVPSIKHVNMNVSMQLDHINAHAHLVMNYSPVESVKVKNISNRNFQVFVNYKKTFFRY